LEELHLNRINTEKGTVWTQERVQVQNTTGTKDSKTTVDTYGGRLHFAPKGKSIKKIARKRGPGAKKELKRKGGNSRAD